jgi:hypothetical protein
MKVKKCFFTILYMKCQTHAPLPFNDEGQIRKVRSRMLVLKYTLTLKERVKK